MEARGSGCRGLRFSWLVLRVPATSSSFLFGFKLVRRSTLVLLVPFVPTFVLAYRLVHLSLLLTYGLAVFLFASTSLDCLQDWARAGTFEPSSPIILKAAPKRLRIPLQIALSQPAPSAGTLPARSTFE
jgi:hypothetical protein